MSRSHVRIVLRSNSIALSLDFVAAGRGVSFLTWLDAAMGVARGDLCFAPLASRRLAERLFLCTAIAAPLDARRLEMRVKLYRGIPEGSGPPVKLP